jgi:hypothetical protein
MDLNLPNTTISSGTDTYSAMNSISANSGFVVSNSASVTFRAGSQITLGPGFHATAGSASPTFHAVIGPITGLVITTTSLPVATVGVCYSVQLTAAGGISPYHNWSAVGSLPPGLALNSSTGVINGTPTTSAGSPFNFNVTVMDNANVTSPPQSLSIPVNTSGGGPGPSREYIRLGNKVIAVENMICTTQ